MEKIELDELNEVSGGKGNPVKQEKYVSAFFCEYCGATIRLNGVYKLDRAKAEHNAKFHPTMKV